MCIDPRPDDLISSDYRQGRVAISMVPIWDGNSEMGALMYSEIGDLICLRQLFRATSVASLRFMCKKDLFFCKRAQRVQSYLEVLWVNFDSETGKS